MKSICFKLLFGYVPLFVTVLFLYLPGLIDFCTNLGDRVPADTGAKSYFSSWMHIKFKGIHAEYCLSYNLFSFLCLSAGIALMLVGISCLKMTPPAGDLSAPPPEASEQRSQDGR